MQMGVFKLKSDFLPAGKLTQAEGAFHIVVRKARAGEKILALDNKEYTLTNSMLVIADGTKDEAIGIAGVKGGTPAGITDTTVDIILEAANFNGVSVRKTAQALKLRTDASSRFEQVISPELAAYGMQNVVEIIQAVAGGELVGYADVYPAPQTLAPVTVTLEKINKILGSTLTSADVADVFARLGFAYKEEAGVFEVVPPFERLDLTIAEDLAEEVGRIVGYDNIPAVPLSPFVGAVEINKDFYTAEKVRQELTAAGYSEVFTSVFADKGERAVLNKVDSVRPYLRATLVDGLNEALKKNLPTKDLLGLKEVKLFEIGTIWKGGGEEMYVGIVTEKEKAVEEPLSMHAPKEVAMQYQELPLSTTERYAPFSKYPYIVRDVAAWVPSGTTQEAVLATITAQAGELLVHSQLFDQFEKAGRTSYAFRLVFQSFERTLTEVEVNEIMEKVYASLKAQGFEIR
jgi:phenylalanyl-tRNA synthetase beta subunit